MAVPNLPNDTSPASLSLIRRKLLAVSPEDAHTPPIPDPETETVDFDAPADQGLLTEELDKNHYPANGYDEVESLLQRYQSEFGIVHGDQGTAGQTRNGAHADRILSPSEPAPGGNFHGEVLRSSGTSRPGLPALSGGNSLQAELAKVRSENAELRSMVAELREYLEAHDPDAMARRLAELEHAVVDKDEELAKLREHVEHWQSQLQTHRLVPSDDEVAQMADEVEKEHCQLAQERKQLETEKAQLKDDEESLMKQMREMEVGMAKDRADLARQRNELQRLSIEIKHEIELLQRGDAGVKDRMAQFQRRHQDAVYRPSRPPQQGPVPPPQATPMSAPPIKPRDSSVFKRLFGQGG